jgi:hypothetical protein
MKGARYTYVGVALLAALVIATQLIGPHLPEPFHLLDGGWLIELGLVVYAAALVVLVLPLTGVLRIREIVGLERAVLAISGVVMITYCIIVSAALYALSRATDL